MLQRDWLSLSPENADSAEPDLTLYVRKLYRELEAAMLEYLQSNGPSETLGSGYVVWFYTNDSSHPDPAMTHFSSM